MPDFFVELAKGFILFVALLESGDKLSNYIHRAADKVSNAIHEQEKEPPAGPGDSSASDESVLR